MCVCDVISGIGDGADSTFSSGVVCEGDMCVCDVISGFGVRCRFHFFKWGGV